jgi:cell division transport system ATP-binding protein
VSRILIAAEPTANLDADYADTIVDMFSSFNQVGVTVLVSTHDDGPIRRLNPRVLTLNRGCLA